MSRGVKQEMVHGTTTGYWKHVRTVLPDGSREKACDACRDAQRRYKANLRKQQYLRRGRPTIIPAIGTIRRVQGMMFMGWTAEHIGAIAYDGTGQKNPARLVQGIHRKVQVHVNTAAAIDRAFRQLGHKRGPSTKTRNYAIRQGWAPPAAFDNIDNPHERPKGVVLPELP